MVVVKRAVGLVVLAVLTGFPATAAVCLALCTAPPVSIGPTPGAPVGHQHDSAHDHGASAPVAATDQAEHSSPFALRGVPGDCASHGPAAVRGLVALVSGRTDADVLGAGQDRPANPGAPLIFNRASNPDAGPPSARRSPPGPVSSTPVPLPLRV